ncbi:hypothetical protein Cadr_000027107 [Camelus dromedarius]|uniref:Uncharacterized protein n=1 Tax=Camelus dromedarius TaxID=9838 RepID=A0A5N4C5H2_CAMDR|nr:hypothetical protein Cadr_000027107 [Camelus dromedarius]
MILSKASAFQLPFVLLDMLYMDIVIGFNNIRLYHYVEGITVWLSQGATGHEKSQTSRVGNLLTAAHPVLGFAPMHLRRALEECKDAGLAKSISCPSL